MASSDIARTTRLSLVIVYGGEPGPRAAGELEATIAPGDERTFDQDPAFTLRMIVDIASKALSPAANDPTTGVQVLDHIGEVLGQKAAGGVHGSPNSTACPRPEGDRTGSTRSTPREMRPR